MARSIAPPRSMRVARLTVRLPTRMINDIQADMSDNGYSPRNQSRWIEEALVGLLESEYYPELVAEDFIAHGRNKPVRITLNGETAHEIEKAIERIEHEEKLVDVQSKLVRTAIRSRLVAAGRGI